ncbi:hypothetical protein Sulku_1422 [Sulfuricurvum kujiense DSM 16994]|uniref:Uncharacterized protein n=1 Tax=Sulfuricurvum kujiense (strain ATCC BAA-921 / DSM 16994 / JCM 11577 / YK-1) TaxID=709032 RepID=E4TZ69_SULKY|nr:hypothetical protein [Sulfuricurvum kujiense]ADR34084.1 hypothetical protein Sulku_1422 [Sulfuricurvum kujiense DSM 16994]
MMQNLLQEAISNFKNAKTPDSKLASINLILQIEIRDQEKYSFLLYKHLKIWLKYYLLSIEKKQFSYDEIVYEKIYKTISYLPTEERVNALNYFIRLLHQHHRTNEIDKYKQLKKKFQLDILLKEHNYFGFIVKLALYDLYSLIMTLLFSLIIFTCIFYHLQENFRLLSISLIEYDKNIFLNYFGNVVAFIFNINKKLLLNTMPELLFMSSMKIYFYFLITYFVVKEISNKVEKI